MTSAATERLAAAPAAPRVPRDVPALALAGITKTFGHTRVLDRVTLRVDARETVALLGANGAGKSTLLRIAATVARPDAGDVRVAGVDARERPEAARARLTFLAQEAPVYAELTPSEHVRWWTGLHGHPMDAASTTAALAEAGLSRLAARRCRGMSRGERQRLGLLLALVPDPALLLLDEPFTALDTEGQTWLARRLDERRGARATLVALHGEERARTFADRLVTIRRGRLEETHP